MRRRPATRGARRGTIFITTMWVTIVLGALVFVLARSMRVELTASANRLSTAKADAIELGAEQYVLAQLDNIDGYADYILQQPGEALSVGDGYFWLLRPSANEQDYEFGITDESSKVNINTATVDSLALLPGMPRDVADSIIDWRDADDVVTEQGAENSYYLSLPEPYLCKNSQFESVLEMYLVKNVDDQLLFGADTNHNGVIDQSEAGKQTLTPNLAGTVSNRGIFPFLTVYSSDTNLDANGEARVDVNSSGGPSTPTVVTAAGAPGQPTPTPAPAPAPAGNSALEKVLQTALSAQRAQQIIAKLPTLGRFANIFDFAKKAGLSQQEFRQIADRITTTNQKTIPGLINVNTAPREVLMTLPGLTEGDADALIATRQQADTTSIAWVSDAISMDKAVAIGNMISNRSFQYSADIVAVSGDGRAFRRVRIVVDATQSPAKIIYRKDLTSQGWPLPASIRDALRAGNEPPKIGVQRPGQRMVP